MRFILWLFRLWHQLTLRLTEFVKSDYFNKYGGLVEVKHYNSSVSSQLGAAEMLKIGAIHVQCKMLSDPFTWQEQSMHVDGFIWIYSFIIVVKKTKN